MGRPPLPAARRMSKVVNLRLTEQQLDQLKMVAYRRKLTVTAWIRRIIFGPGD